MSEKQSTVYVYTSCLSFNFWLEILWWFVSATGSHAGEFVGVLVPFDRWLSQDAGQSGGTLDPQLSRT